MAFIILIFYCFVFLSASSPLHSSYVDGGETESYHRHEVSVQSLLPGAVCSPSKVSHPSTLKVVHRHGPCSPLSSRSNVSHHQILNQDQARADSLHRRISAAESQSLAGGSLAVSIPAHTGASLGTGNYIVTLGFGTPKKELSVIFDTGSDLTWVQCRPCKCYPQAEQLYDRSQSSTYQNISCSSAECTQLDSSSCSPSSTCRYKVSYGDNSQSDGFLIRDTLTLSQSDVLPNFRFGCGDSNSGLFGEAAGLLGLGREQVSLVSQEAQRYGSVFSYCLPSTASSTGKLTLGGAAPPNVKFTPMLTVSSSPSFYFVKLIGIYVGGKRLSVQPTVFSNPGTLVDSGTVITRLPSAAYSELRSTFQQQIGRYKYPKAQPLEILDTCYDFTGYKKVLIPAITLLFDGGVKFDVDFSGILYVANVSQVCLAFAANSDAGDVAIVGNVQQRRFNVVYDVGNKRIGFGPKGC